MKHNKSLNIYDLYKTSVFVFNIPIKYQMSHLSMLTLKFIIPYICLYAEHFFKCLENVWATSFQKYNTSTTKLLWLWLLC